MSKRIIILNLVIFLLIIFFVLYGKINVKHKQYTYFSDVFRDTEDMYTYHIRDKIYLKMHENYSEVFVTVSEGNNILDNEEIKYFDDDKWKYSVYEVEDIKNKTFFPYRVDEFIMIYWGVYGKVAEDTKTVYVNGEQAKIINC